VLGLSNWLESDCALLHYLFQIGLMILICTVRSEFLVTRGLNLNIWGLNFLIFEDSIWKSEVWIFDLFEDWVAILENWIWISEVWFFELFDWPVENWIYISVVFADWVWKVEQWICILIFWVTTYHILFISEI